MDTRNRKALGIAVLAGLALAVLMAEPPQAVNCESMGLGVDLPPEIAARHASSP